VLEGLSPEARILSQALTVATPPEAQALMADMPWDRKIALAQRIVANNMTGGSGFRSAANREVVDLGRGPGGMEALQLARAGRPSAGLVGINEALQSLLPGLTQSFENTTDLMNEIKFRANQGDSTAAAVWEYLQARTPRAFEILLRTDNIAAETLQAALGEDTSLYEELMREDRTRRGSALRRTGDGLNPALLEAADIRAGQTPRSKGVVDVTPLEAGPAPIGMDPTLGRRVTVPNLPNRFGTGLLPGTPPTPGTRRTAVPPGFPDASEAFRFDRPFAHLETLEGQTRSGLPRILAAIRSAAGLEGLSPSDFSFSEVAPRLPDPGQLPGGYAPESAELAESPEDRARRLQQKALAKQADALTTDKYKGSTKYLKGKQQGRYKMRTGNRGGTSDTLRGLTYLERLGRLGPEGAAAIDEALAMSETMRSGRRPFTEGRRPAVPESLLRERGIFGPGLSENTPLSALIAPKPTTPANAQMAEPGLRSPISPETSALRAALDGMDVPPPPSPPDPSEGIRRIEQAEDAPSRRTARTGRPAAPVAEGPAAVVPEVVPRLYSPFPYTFADAHTRLEVPVTVGSTRPQWAMAEAAGGSPYSAVMDAPYLETQRQVLGRTSGPQEIPVREAPPLAEGSPRHPAYDPNRAWFAPERPAGPLMEAGFTDALGRGALPGQYSPVIGPRIAANRARMSAIREAMRSRPAPPVSVAERAFGREVRPGPLYDGAAMPGGAVQYEGPAGPRLQGLAGLPADRLAATLTRTEFGAASPVGPQAQIMGGKFLNNFRKPVPHDPAAYGSVFAPGRQYDMAAGPGGSPLEGLFPNETTPLGPEVSEPRFRSAMRTAAGLDPAAGEEYGRLFNPRDWARQDRFSQFMDPYLPKRGGIRPEFAQRLERIANLGSGTKPFPMTGPAALGLLGVADMRQRGGDWLTSLGVPLGLLGGYAALQAASGLQGGPGGTLPPISRPLNALKGGTGMAARGALRALGPVGGALAGQEAFTNVFGDNPYSRGAGLVGGGLLGLVPGAGGIMAGGQMASHGLVDPIAEKLAAGEGVLSAANVFEPPKRIAAADVDPRRDSAIAYIREQMRGLAPPAPFANPANPLVDRYRQRAVDTARHLQGLGYSPDIVANLFQQATGYKDAGAQAEMGGVTSRGSGSLLQRALREAALSQ